MSRSLVVTTLAALSVFFVMPATASSASAATYKCKGERIEKGSSTWGYAKSSGSDYRIEKGSSSIGWAKSRNSNYAIETFGGSTLGWLKGDRIETTGGSSWAKLRDATDIFDCPAPIAAALWVLMKSGKF